jgi:hypothetical protein
MGSYILNLKSRTPMDNNNLIQIIQRIKAQKDHEGQKDTNKPEILSYKRK